MNTSDRGVPTYEDIGDAGPCRFCGAVMVFHEGPLGRTFIHRYSGSKWCQGGFNTQAEPRAPVADHNYRHKRQA
jgi:hypothetical protein